MAVNLFRRYIWLISTILQSRRITYKDISEKWAKSGINDEKDSPLPKRTFARHKQAVSDMLGIKIDFRKTDNSYGISNMDEIQSDEQKEWVISSFSVINMLQESYMFKDRILFEKVPGGTEYLTTILEAIKTNRLISFTYKKFKSSEYKQINGAPYCLRIDKQRWYVLIKTESQGLRTYALDRISDMNIKDETFRLAKDFSASEYYHDSYGIWVPDKEAERVRIKAFGKQVNYFRTLPLHHSQREENIDDESSIFEYYIKIDVEFTSELFKWGPMVQVLEPRSLVNEFKEMANQMQSMYSK